MTRFKAAALQMRSGIDPENNAQTLRRLVREAAGNGASYIQTPEMTGAVQKDRKGLMAVLKSEADDIIVKNCGGPCQRIRHPPSHRLYRACARGWHDRQSRPAVRA